MARKEMTMVVEAAGRDHDKAFFIREMPAYQAEMWALRALLALAKSGVDVPENIVSAGMAGVFALGLKAFAGLSFTDAAPLLDEMMACVQIIPDPGRPTIKRGLVEDDIEEVATRVKLRAQVFELHTGFSLAAGPSKSTPSAAMESSSSNTRTSRAL
jgi:hypothetical protein